MDKLLPDLSSEALRNVKVDTLKFGSAFTGEQLATKGVLSSVTEGAWLKSTLLTLVGFAVYQLVVRRLISTSFTSGNYRMALDDVLKFGTMLIASRVLSGKPLTGVEGRAWQSESAYILLGFVAYDLGTKPLMTRFVLDTQTLEYKHAMMADDALKFGTMFTVSRFLSGEAFDMAWGKTVAGFLGGLAAYNYLLARYLQ
jgi:hypothetical protein